MMDKKTLVINDFVGSSHIALNLQLDYLFSRRESTLSIPSAIISNSFNLGEPEILDLSDYLNETLNRYDSMDFQYKALLTGYLLNFKQVETILKWKESRPEVLFIADPIMGDNGSLYKSLTSETINHYKSLVKNSDIMVPNMTEAQLLLDVPLIEANMNKTEIKELVMSLQKINKKSVIITSSIIDDKSFIAGYDHLINSYFEIPFDHIMGSYYGTGDLFSVALLCSLLSGSSLEEAANIANYSVKQLILHYNG